MGKKEIQFTAQQKQMIINEVSRLNLVNESCLKYAKSWEEQLRLIRIQLYKRPLVYRQLENWVGGVF